MNEVRVVHPEDEDSPWIDLEDDQGNHLCRVDYDDHPDQVLHKVAGAVCKAASIKFVPADGWR